MNDALQELAEYRNVIIISGAGPSQIEQQIPIEDEYWEASLRITKMSQNGNVCEDINGIKWYRKLDTYSRMAVFSHINSIMKKFPIRVDNIEDLVEDRGAQISYSLVGHNASSKKKSVFDPGGDLRRAVLHFVPFNIPGLTVRVGGTTCLDYIAEDGTKAHNLQRLLTPDELANAIYVGDQLYPGGNDNDVRDIPGLDCLPVGIPEETLRFIQGELEMMRV
jgi:hypothetical protein